MAKPPVGRLSIAMASGSRPPKRKHLVRRLLRRKHRQKKQLKKSNTVDDKRMREAWRVQRINAELVNGIEKLVDLGPSVTLYGSARLGEQSQYYQAAMALGEKLSQAGINVLTGGGPGIMGAGNRGADQNGAYSIGQSGRASCRERE